MTEEQGQRQKHQTLSFLGGMLTFQCSGPRDTGNQRGSVLTFSRLSFQRDGGCFSKTHHGGAFIKSSSDVDIVKCSSVLDVKKRVTIPCILLTQRTERDSFKYSVLSLNSLNSIETHLEFELPYQMRENVAILRGPTVLWSYDGFAFYTSLQGGEVKQIPTKLSLNLIGESPLNTGKIFILCSQTPSKESTGSQPYTAANRKNCGYFIQDGQLGLFDGDLMLPHEYSSITQCIFVVSAEEANGVFKSTVVAATSKNQLVCFENGIPREVCKLPFEEPVDNIQMVNTGRNGSLFVLSFNQGHVCAIWMDTFQVASCWSGVRFLHVDDFLGCGTDQILLVFEVQSLTDCPLDNFLITDLCGTTYSRGQESRDAGKTSDMAQENLVLTVKALESRLQSGLTALQDLRRGGRMKERLLLQSVQALTDLVSGREHVLTRPEQEGLTCLWDEDEESEDESGDEKMQVSPAVPPPPPPPLVDKLWHRVVDDHLVVGVILAAESIVATDGVGLSILAPTGQNPAPAVVQTRGRVSWLPAPRPLPPRPEPAAKRRREDGASGNDGDGADARPARLAVTSVTSLTPLLTSGHVKCLVMLHYVPSQSASPAVVQCGQVPVDVGTEHQLQLLNNCKLTTDEAREDLLSLLAVLDGWTLQIESPEHSLGDVSSWIRTRMHCETLGLRPDLLLSSPAGPSAVSLFHWKQNSPFRGELSVYCSEFRLLRFLESLRGFLPASCSVRPLRHGGEDGSALSLSLERELLSLRDGLNALLCGEEEEEERKSGSASHLEAPDPGCAEAVQRSRDWWQRDRERSCRRLSPLVDVASYSRLTQSLARRQLEGDVAALLEIQRTLNGSGLN